MKINILTIAWNRFPERFDYFQVMVNSIKENLSLGHHEYEWIVSIESERHLLKKEMEDFCNKNNIKYYYKPGKPLLATNLNYGLSLCKQPFIFYIQDDFILLNKLDISKDIDFMIAHKDISIIRYRDTRAAERVYTKQVDKNLDLWEVSNKVPYYYNDNPQLKRKDLVKLTGDFCNKYEFPDKGFDDSSCETMMARKMKQLSRENKVRILSKHTGSSCFGVQTTIGKGKVSTLKEKWEAQNRALKKRGLR